MKRPPSFSIIRGLLFTYDIENTDDLERESLIASKNINDEKELMELFDELPSRNFCLTQSQNKNGLLNRLNITCLSMTASIPYLKLWRPISATR